MEKTLLPFFFLLWNHFLPPLKSSSSFFLNGPNQFPTPSHTITFFLLRHRIITSVIVADPFYSISNPLRQPIWKPISLQRPSCCCLPRLHPASTTIPIAVLQNHFIEKGNQKRWFGFLFFIFLIQTDDPNAFSISPVSKYMNRNQKFTDTSTNWKHESMLVNGNVELR